MIHNQYLKIARHYLLILGFVCCGCLAFTQNQTPYISFQGILKKISGEPVTDGDYDFTFSFWSTPSGTSNDDKLLKTGATDNSDPANQWSETVTLTVTGGVYSHNLGSVTPLNPNNFTGPVYLNIRVGGKDQLPRTEFTYSPYSFFVYNARTVVCSGAVGDVKYSILPPDQFKDANGDCWVPLDGRTLASTDALYQQGITMLPNAGGLFLRAQDFAIISGSEYWKPKNNSDNDPNRTASTAIGSVQNSAFKSHVHTVADDGAHNHSVNRRSNGGIQNGDNDLINTDKSIIGTSYSSYAGGHNHTINANSDGGSTSETRPANLNLWVYVRIN
jgi:hypothetical protein